MTSLSSSELSLIRTRPHRTKLWLSIYQPESILAGQINKVSAAQGDMSFTYDLIAGSEANVREGMTMYVGTTAGGSDKGRIRIKSAVTGTVNVAENSYINWADDDFITVVDFYEIQAKYPRIITDPADDTQTLWYKDYDVEYTNQNTVQGAFPCMGSHFAGFLEDDGNCDVFYTATGTAHVVNGVTLSYFWTFEGASTASGTGMSPGYIQYTSAGHYTTSLLVSGSNGSSDLSYRHVSIYKRPEVPLTGDTQIDFQSCPILKWELDKLSGSHEGGGYTATIRILQNVPETYVKDGSLVVIFADDWYGSTKQSIGGNAQNRPTIVFVGYVLNGTIRFNWKSKEITFDVGSPTEIMKISDSFSVSIEDIDDPVTAYNNNRGYYVSPWTLLVGMNVKKAIHHYLKWHSTVMYCCDFHFEGTDQLIQYFDVDRESLYASINTIMRSALYGALTSDRQGTLWAETEIYTETPSTKRSNTFILDDEDWVGEPNIEESLVNQVSYLEAGGIVYPGFSGTTAGSSTPLLSAAPGQTPGYKGEVQKFQGLALSSQAQLNILVGSVYSYMNRKYPRINFDLAGNYRFFDVAPEEKFQISIASDKNPRQTAININVFINQLSLSYNPRNESLITKISCSQITTPSTILASSLAIPVIPPGTSTPPFVLPPFEIPPFEIPVTGIGEVFVPAVGGNFGADTAIIVGAWYDGTSWTASDSGGQSLGLLFSKMNMSEPIGCGATMIPSGRTGAIVYPVITGAGSGYIYVNVRAWTLSTNTFYSADGAISLSFGQVNIITEPSVTVPSGGVGTALAISTWSSSSEAAADMYLLGWLVNFI